MYTCLDGEILQVEPFMTATQQGTVGVHYCWAHVLHVKYQGGSLHCEVRQPVIDGTEWQGQLVEVVPGQLWLTVDDSEPVELYPIAGVADEPVTFTAPGVYLLTVTPGFKADPVSVEVTVP